MRAIVAGVAVAAPLALAAAAIAQRAGCFDAGRPLHDALWDPPPRPGPEPELAPRPEPEPPPPGTVIIDVNTPICVDGQLVEAIGIRNIGEHFFPLLNTGTECPTTITQSFGSKMPSFSFIEVEIFSGRGRLVSQLRFLGRYRIERNPPEPWGGGQVSLAITVDEHKRILLGTGRGYEITSIGGP